MPVTLVGTKWTNGKLHFFNKSTGAILMTIGPDGVNIRTTAASVSPSDSPSVSPSISPSASPSA